MLKCKRDHVWLMILKIPVRCPWEIDLVKPALGDSRSWICLENFFINFKIKFKELTSRRGSVLKPNSRVSIDWGPAHLQAVGQPWIPYDASMALHRWKLIFCWVAYKRFFSMDLITPQKRISKTDMALILKSLSKFVTCWLGLKRLIKHLFKVLVGPTSIKKTFSHDHITKDII